MITIPIYSILVIYAVFVLAVMALYCISYYHLQGTASLNIRSFLVSATVGLAMAVIIILTVSWLFSRGIASPAIRINLNPAGGPSIF